MVCDKCEEKLSKLVVPDKWTDGARNTTGGKDGGRKVGGNRLLKKRAERILMEMRLSGVVCYRFTPMERKCRICKCKAGQHCHYCNQCAYKKGICAMCGRKVLDTKEFNMSS